MRKLKTYEIERLSVENFRQAQKHPLWILLDNIRSANNVGSVFRTADTFRLAGIGLCGITPHPPHREIYKTALGATSTMEWKSFGSSKKGVEHFLEQDIPVIAIEQAQGSVKLNDFNPPSHRPIALLFGNEVEGVDREAFELVNHCVEIPQFGTKHSLNISVSVGVVIWDVLNKMEMMAPNR